MRNTVPFKRGLMFKPARVLNARRARIPGMPWFKCFTNRWWSPNLGPLGIHRYMLTEETTGLVPISYSVASRTNAINEAHYRLYLRKRTVILATIARVNAGHLDRLRIPQHFKHRTR